MQTKNQKVTHVKLVMVMTHVKRQKTMKVQRIGVKFFLS